MVARCDDEPSGELECLLSVLVMIQVVLDEVTAALVATLGEEESGDS